MQMWMYAALAAVLTAAATWWLAALVHGARRSALETERDLLRERVDDLEISLSEDLQTAALLAPLKDALGRVERQVGVLERDRVEQFGSIRSVLARVEGGTAELGLATASLVGSLRSSTVRGAWGEVQLRRVLELSGMLARCDFDMQVSATARHGAVRPDVLVRLPGDKVLVIDAKAPMDAFLAAQAQDLPEDERSQLLREHAVALRRHVQALAAKEYWTAFPVTPEMVVCFVPTDAMLAAALDAQPGLHEAALADRVVLVGPAGLMALVRTVAFTWQQSAVVEHAAEVLTLGRDLYARLSTLGEHTAKVGRSLTASVEAYNGLVGALESRVLVSARRMQDLGVVSSALPELSSADRVPRPLTAYELIEQVTRPDRRVELDLEGQWSEPASDAVKDAS